VDARLCSGLCYRRDDRVQLIVEIARHRRAAVADGGLDAEQAADQFSVAAPTARVPGAAASARTRGLRIPWGAGA